MIRLRGQFTFIQAYNEQKLGIVVSKGEALLLWAK